MTKQEWLLSHVHHRQILYRELSDIHSYFTNLRYSIISRCLPKILFKNNGEIEYLYSDNVNKTIKYINTIENKCIKTLFENEQNSKMCNGNNVEKSVECCKTNCW